MTAIREGNLKEKALAYTLKDLVRSGFGLIPGCLSPTFSRHLFIKGLIQKRMWYFLSIYRLQAAKGGGGGKLSGACAVTASPAVLRPRTTTPGRLRAGRGRRRRGLLSWRSSAGNFEWRWSAGGQWAEEPPASFGEAMDSLVEPRWPPGLEVMKVRASGRLGAPGCQPAASPVVRGPGASGQLGPGARLRSAICPLRGSGPQFPGDRPRPLLVS